MDEIDAVGDDVHGGEVVDAAETDGEDDAEGHAADDEQGVDGAGGAGYDVVVEHVINGVDERDARYDEEAAGDHGMPGSR